MAHIIITRRAQLSTAVNTESLPGLLYAGENDTHVFIISAVRGDTPVTLAGAVTALFMRPDESTVALDGEIVNGCASVTLPQSCYTQTGRFQLTVFVTENGVKTAVYCLSGNVKKTSTETIIDPGHVVPDISDIIAEYATMQQAVEDCEDAAEAANTAASAADTAAANVAGAIADAYSTSGTYAVGDYCTKDGKLYRCVSAISTAEAWTTAHWTEVQTMEEVSELKSAVNDISEPFTWKPGYYNIVNGYYNSQTEPATYHCTERYDGDKLPALVGTELFTSDSFIMVWKGVTYQGYLMDGVWKKNTTVLPEAPEFTQWAVVLHNVSNYTGVRLIPYLDATMDEVNESAEAYINGRAIRIAHLFPVATSSTIYKITVNESNIIIPKFCCVFYGNRERYRFSTETTVARVAYGSSTANAEYLIFNETNKTLRFEDSSPNVAVIGADDYLVATFQYGLNGNSLPPSYINDPTDEVTIFTHNDKNTIDERIIETKYCGNNNKTGLTLLHFSDIHGSTANISRILQLYSAYSGYIDDVLHTGDSVTTYFSNDNPFDTVGGSQILNVLGNHECWIQGDTWPHPYNVTAAQAYSKIFVGSDSTNPHISSWGVTSAGENLCYYYKDYTNYNIRLIVLDSVHYDAAQETWFTQTLASAKTGGLSVIVAVHYPAQSGITPISCTFTSYGKVLEAVADPAEGAQMERLQDSAFDCVDDFIAGGGKFICWLAGHVHYDYVGTVTEHSNQLMILVNCGLSSDGYGTERRVVGTKTQDAMNVIGFDTTNKLVKICRIGISQDWFGRAKNLLCVSYDTKQVIGNS